MPWKPEVFVEGKWSANRLVFATNEEAGEYAADLFQRWTACENHRAVESSEAVNALYKNGKLTQPWQDRILGVTEGTQLGAIARCVLGRNEHEDVGPAFIGKASVTSDGFVMCSYVDPRGNRHMGAFVGSWQDLRDNVQGVADSLQLNEADRGAWLKAVSRWIAQDWRGSPDRSWG